MTEAQSCRAGQSAFTRLTGSDGSYCATANRFHAPHRKSDTRDGISSARSLLSYNDRSNSSTLVRRSFGLRDEIEQTLRLGIPLSLGELGWMSTYIVDALMIGRLPNSALAISASSLGNTIFYAIAFCAIFLMNGLETLIAQAYGRDDREECTRLLMQSAWLVAIFTPAVMLLTLAMLAMLPHFGTPPEIVRATASYVRTLIWSTAPLLAYMALRRYLQSINRVAMVSISLLTASVVNFVADWIFVFGHMGAPAMGVVGSARATVVVRLYMLALLALGVLWAMRDRRDRPRLRMLRPSPTRLRALLRIGWPSGLENLEELGVSAYMSILCARLGPTLLAAHQVVLDLNAFVYQVSVGLSYATVVRVGQSAGRANLQEVRRAARASLLLGLGFMLVAGTVFAAFAHHWAALYTNSEAVVVAAVPIFTICAVLLLGDTMFVMIASALTGMGDTRTPLVVSAVWSWGVGIPVGYLLTFHYGHGLGGLWLGRAIGSVGAGLTLALLWHRRMLRNEHGGRSARPGLLETLPVTK